VIRSLVLSGAAALSLALAVSAPVLAQPAASAASATSTDDFITAVRQSDDFERTTGRMAQQSGLTQGVRDYGAMMVTDHTKTTEDFKAAIAKSGRPVPAEPPLTRIQQQGVNSLKNQVGMPLFDSSYLAQQVRAHKQALALLQSYAQHGQDATLRAAAAHAVPIVEHHLKTAQDLAHNLH
jgi:putative membrane protein